MNNTQVSVSSTNQRHLNQMKALIKQAIAESHHQPEKQLAGIHLIIYGEISPETVMHLYAEATRGTLAETAKAHLHSMGSRFVCWNCCGLQFESEDAVCPNCGETSLEVPESIAFSLRNIDLEDRVL